MELQFDTTQLFKKIDEMTKGEEKRMEKACALVERSAKQKAPKDTSHLTRSIESVVEKEGEQIVGTIFTPLEYAPYIEYGTGLFAEAGDGRQEMWRYQDAEGNWHSTCGQPPQPFLRPALAENRNKIIKILGGHNE